MGNSCSLSSPLTVRTFGLPPDKNGGVFSEKPIKSVVPISSPMEEIPTQCSSRIVDSSKISSFLQNSSGPSIASDSISRFLPFGPNCMREQVINEGKSCRQTEGAVAFVDISGFSALANALGKSEKGAMVLSQCINEFLSLLIAVVHDYCGDIVTFAGDAFIALWQNVPSCTHHAALFHATRCALTMQQKFNAYTVPGTNVILRIHIGIDYGFFTGITVTTSLRNLFLLTGRPLMTMSDVIDAASPGEVCLSSAAGSMINEFIEQKPLENGVVLVREVILRPLPPYCGSDSTQWNEEDRVLLESYIPSVLLEHLRESTIEKGEAVLALRRFVSVLFFGQPDLLYNDISDVQIVLGAALKIVLQNGGEVLQALQDDKGLHMVAVFGIHPTDQPGIAAIQSAQEMMASTFVNGNKRCRIGVATGKVFCGIIGSEQRKAFDILGDSVNLACRLMQLCSNTNACFLCDEATHINCGGKFLFTKHPQQYQMKGQAAKLSVYSVEGNQEYENLGLDTLRRRLQIHATVVCGRHQERAILDGAIRTVLRRKPPSPAVSQVRLGRHLSYDGQMGSLRTGGFNFESPPRRATLAVEYAQRTLQPNVAVVGKPPLAKRSSLTRRPGSSSPSPNPSPTNKAPNPLGQFRFPGSAAGSSDGTDEAESFSASPGSPPRNVAIALGPVLDGARRGSLVNPVGGNRRPSLAKSNSVGSSMVVQESPMLVFEGPMGSGKSTLAVFLQNEWPLLPIIVAQANKHDRKPFAIFQRLLSSLFGWVRLYPATCNINVTAETQDEDIIRQLLPGLNDAQLCCLDSALATRFTKPRTPSPDLLQSPTSPPSTEASSSTSSARLMPILPGMHPQPILVDEMDHRSPKNVAGKTPAWNPLSVGSRPRSPSANLQQCRVSSIASLLFDLFVGFCARVPALVLCYDDIQHMDSESQDLVEQLHDWATNTPVPFLQVLFVETGFVGILPRGAVRHELRDLTTQDIREFLRQAFGDRVVETDILTDALCHLIGRKASYNAMMMAELAKLISEPRMLQYVRTDGRTVVHLGSRALSEILEFDYSRSHAISQMVAYEFDNFDAPQQIIAKAASVILSHPEARLYRPQVHHLVPDFDPVVVDEALDKFIAHRILVVDTAGQPLVEEWRSISRYKFTLECFGSVLTSLMSPNTVAAMNKRLALFLEKYQVYATAINYDVWGFYYLHGQCYDSAAKTLMDAIDLYIEDDESSPEVPTSEPFAQSQIFRALTLRSALNLVLGHIDTSIVPSTSSLHTLVMSLSHSPSKRIKACIGTSSMIGGMGWTAPKLVDEVARQVNARLAAASERLERHKFGTFERAEVGALIEVEHSGILDLDASARRMVMLLQRIEESCRTKKQLNLAMWRQFLLLLEGYQRIQRVVVNTAHRQLRRQPPSPTSADSPLQLQTSRIAECVRKIESGNQTDRLLQMKKLTSVLTTSIHTATTSAREVIAMPISEGSFEWQDSFLMNIPLVDQQHRQLFVILKRFANVVLNASSSALSTSFVTTTSSTETSDATSSSPDRLNSELGVLFKWLLEYVLFHFLAEEALMRKINYPQFKAHQFVHQTFTQQCLSLQSRFSENTLVVDGALVSSLHQWLAVHIGNSDHHVASFYHSLNDRQSNQTSTTPSPSR